MKRRVVVTQRFFDDATIEYLKSNDCEVVVVDLPPGTADGDAAPDTLRQWLKARLAGSSAMRA